MNIELREGEIDTGRGELVVEAFIHGIVESPIIGRARPGSHFQHYRAVGELVYNDRRRKVGAGEKLGNLGVEFFFALLDAFAGAAEKVP